MRYIFFLALMTFSLTSFTTTYAQNYSGKKKDINQILANVNSFSSFYANGEYSKLANCYTLDGKIFPEKTNIIEGREAIEKRWTLPKGVKILKHEVRPVEITIVKKTAYDYGYYSGKTLDNNGEESSWKGKYVIVWKKVKGEWKIYLDIWNRVGELE